MNTSQTPLKSCIISKKSGIIFAAWAGINFTLLPIFLSVLYVGYRKWRKQRSSITHSDVFTFHMVALEMINIVGCCLVIYGYDTSNDRVTFAGEHLIEMVKKGQVSFHCLTCGERYMAVVHPITYLHLKKGGGVTIRNVSIAIVWVLSIGIICLLTSIHSDTAWIVFGCIFTFFPLIVVAYLSAAVLCVLIRPGPGEGGRDKRSIDQSKRAAFITMAAILGALMVKFFELVAYHGIFINFGHSIDDCVLSMSCLWFDLPSNLVLPLLFLHRAGKLTR